MDPVPVSFRYRLRFLLNCDGSTPTLCDSPVRASFGVPCDSEAWTFLRVPNRQNFATLSLVASPVNESAITTQVPQVLVY
jgi:hypothetical protein